MAKKRRRRRASMLTKAINIGVLLLGFSRPIQLALAGNTNAIVFEASAGLAGAGGGRFDKDAAIRFYGPVVAAILMKKAISMLRRTAHV